MRLEPVTTSLRSFMSALSQPEADGRARGERTAAQAANSAKEWLSRSSRLTHPGTPQTDGAAACRRCRISPLSPLLRAHDHSSVAPTLALCSPLRSRCSAHGLNEGSLRAAVLALASTFANSAALSVIGSLLARKLSQRVAAGERAPRHRTE